VERARQARRPPESHPQLLDRLARMDGKLPLDVPERLRGPRLAEPPTVVVRVRLLPAATLELEAFVRPATGGALLPPGAGPHDVMIVRDGERGYVRRELDTEHERVARLPLDTAAEGPPMCFQVDDPDAALAVVAAIQQPPPGLEAEWIDPPPTIVRSRAPDALRVTASASATGRHRRRARGRRGPDRARRAARRRAPATPLRAAR
jgi:hypothetical protein